MFNDKPPLIGKVSTADRMAKASYKKLQLRNTRPFRVKKMQLHTVALDKGGVPNTVSIHRVPTASRLKELPATAQAPSSPKNKTHTVQQQKTRQTSVGVCKTPPSVSKYAVDHIVGHEDYGWNRVHRQIVWVLTRGSHAGNSVKHPKPHQHTVPQTGRPNTG